MNYTISGKNIDVTEGLRDAVYDKLGGGGETGNGSGPRRARKRDTPGRGPGRQQTASGLRRTDRRRGCLENPRDRGACWAAVYGVTQSRTHLKQLSSNSISALHFTACILYSILQ